MPAFRIELYAKPAEVGQLLEIDPRAREAPECAKDFVRRAVFGMVADAVHIKVEGKLYNDDFQTSYLNIAVRPIRLATVSAKQEPPNGDDQKDR